MSGANTIAVIDALQARLPQLEDSLPEGIDMVVVADSSQSIRASLAQVERTLFEGALLTVLIVYLFLGSWRSTVITGLTIPIALLGTVFALYAFGLTLNSMTLMAMSLSIGLLIDDAIVVRENIVRHAAMGKSPRQAALDGTREIGLAVVATTLTIVAVFLPVAFMDGIIGRFFYQFGIAVSCAVLLSMLVSFTLDPMLSARWPEPPGHRPDAGTRCGRFLLRIEAWLSQLGAHYERAIAWALANRLRLLGYAVLSLLLALAGAAWSARNSCPSRISARSACASRPPWAPRWSIPNARRCRWSACCARFPRCVPCTARSIPAWTSASIAWCSACCCCRNSSGNVHSRR